MVAYEEISRFGRLGGGYSGRWVNYWADRSAVDESQELGSKPTPGRCERRVCVRFLPSRSRTAPGHSAVIPSSSLRCSRTAFARWECWTPWADEAKRRLILHSSRELPSVAGRSASGREHLPARAESPAGPRSKVRRVGWTSSSTHAKYGRGRALNL